MKYFSWCTILVVGLLVNTTNKVKSAKMKQTKTSGTTPTMSTLDEIAMQRPKQKSDGDVGEMPLVRPLVEIKDLEGAYLQQFGNCTKNGTNLWPDAKKMEQQNKLAPMCTRAHFLHGGDMYETIEEAKVVDGTLHFVKRENKKHGPLRINVVKYKSGLEDKYYYLTKGMKPTLLFYVQHLNNDSLSDYFLSECVQEVPMPKL